MTGTAPTNRPAPAAPERGEPFSPTSDEGAHEPRSRALWGLAKVLVGVLIGVAVVDVGVGVIQSWGNDGPLSNARGLQLDAELGISLKPGFSNEQVQVNAIGYRGPEIPEDAPKDELRIVATGASNTFGLGVKNEETWSYALERKLSIEFTPRPRVINGAVEGYSIVQSVRRAARLIDRLDPDLVLVMVFPGRQALYDTSPSNRWARVDGMVVPRELVEDWPESMRWIPARMHTTLLSSNLYSRMHAQTQMRKGAPASVANWVLTSADPPEVLRAGIEETRREVTGLVQLAKERGVELRIVVGSETRGANDVKWDGYISDLAASGAPPPSTPKEEPFDALIAWLEPTGATLWDMRETLFALAGDWETNVMDANLHWSPAGHELVANAWRKRLVDTGLLESLAAKRRAAPRAFHVARDVVGVPEAQLAESK